MRAWLELNRRRDELEDRHRELDFTYSLVDVFVLFGEVILAKAVTSSARVERR